MYIRKQWIEKSSFHDTSQKEILENIAAQVQESSAAKKNPIVVFDLDSTLFNVSNRSYVILKEWLDSHETAQFDATKRLLSDLDPSDMEYSLQDVWEKKGIAVEDQFLKTHFNHAKQFWRKRFFSNDYLGHDEPTAGGLAYVKKLYELGAKIVYLTGRDIPLMAFGTYDQLKSHGFPLDADQTRLILKPKRHVDDLEFKTGIMKNLSEMGQVVAHFENEPKNLVAMAKVLQEHTMNVFIETVSSDHPAPPGSGFYRIRDFL